MASPLNITYDRHGFPVELLGERDWRRAIERGRIVRGMLVTVKRGTGPSQLMPAADVPELRDIFEEFDPSPVVVEPLIAAAVREETPPAAPLLVEEVPAFVPALRPPAKPRREGRSAPAPPQASPAWSSAQPGTDALTPPPSRAAAKAAGAIFAILLLLALLGRCGSSAPQRGEISSDMVENAAVAAQSAQPAALVFPTSFDCGSASSSTERSICGNRDLAAQDREMARLYADALAQRDGAARERLQEEQRGWLTQRNACGEGAYPLSCLSQLYVDRIMALQNLRAEPPVVVEPAEDEARATRRRAEAKQEEAAPPPAAILCILPDGSEARVSLVECRQRSGVVMSE